MGNFFWVYLFTARNAVYTILFPPPPPPPPSPSPSSPWGLSNTTPNTKQSSKGRKEGVLPHDDRSCTVISCIRLSLIVDIII